MSVRVRRRDVPAQATKNWPEQVHPVLRRIYAARGVTEAGDIEHRLARLQPPRALDGLDRATALLDQAIADDRHILIAGDYDCDGATGTAVAVRGLRLLGARHVDYVVPNRMTQGYGLSPALVDALQHTPDLIVTVDNGIASVAGVAAAKARGIQVIVTDHHLPGEQLPDADAIVDPALVRTSCARESKSGDPSPHFSLRAATDQALGNLAGVGVMFYVLLALRARMRERGAFTERADPDLSSLLDLVALGTVADMVALDYNNRILVESGLRRIRAGKACVGIVALAQVSMRSTATLVAADIGFALAPRLNAAGRLEDMRVGIECLLSDDPAQAQGLATHLSAINQERRELQAGMVAAAEALVAATQTPDAIGVALFDKNWHPGVVGLVASRLKERLHRPVVAFAPAGADSEEMRGSARSIPGFHIRDALAEVDALHPGLIPRFGGHAMAAGLSLARTDFTRFASAFDDVATAHLGAESLQSALWSDGSLGPGQFTLELARTLRYAGPWGQGFAEPLFDDILICVQQRPMGRAHRRLRLRDPRDDADIDAVMFNVADDLPVQVPLHVVYGLTINDWQGRETVRLLLRHVHPASANCSNCC